MSEYVGRHRLSQDFANRPNVLFFGMSGDLWNTSLDRSVAYVDRGIDTGDTWEV